MKKDEDKSKKRRLTTFSLWVIAGVFSILGTIAVGEIVSIYIRPLLIMRYIYPVASVAWLLLGACLSKLDVKIKYRLH